MSKHLLNPEKHGRHRKPNQSRINYKVAGAAAGTALILITPMFFISADPSTISNEFSIPASITTPSNTLRAPVPTTAAAALKVASDPTSTTTSPPPPVVVPPVTAQRPAPPPPTRAARTAPTGGVMAIAHSLVDTGIDYCWGGKDISNCLDCSGFVWYVLKKAGLGVPYRNSTALAGWTTNVSRSAAVPGDLVLYSGHVGFYAGNGMIIDHGVSNGAKLRPIWGTPSYGRMP